MRPKVRVFERYKVTIPGSIQAYQPGEGFFAEISWETELKAGETPQEGVKRALGELGEMVRGTTMGAHQPQTFGPESLEERMRRVTRGSN